MKITKKSLQAKAKEIKGKAMKATTSSVKADEVDEDFDEQAMALGGLFGDEEPVKSTSNNTETDDKKKADDKSLKSINPNECKVIGFVLLTKPASMNVMDPVTVGCIYFNG